VTPRAEALTLRGRVRIAPGAAAILIVLAVVAILSTSMRTAVAGTVPIAVGGEAPEIRLGDQHGKTLVLSALLKQRTFVVLAFYPKAFTSG
jgi:hypothetical protein